MRGACTSRQHTADCGTCDAADGTSACSVSRDATDPDSGQEGSDGPAERARGFVLKKGLPAIVTSSGIRGREYTPTVDGNFDRISSEIDPAFGTEAQYLAMVQHARDNGAVLIGDIIPALLEKRIRAPRVGRLFRHDLTVFGLRSVEEPSQQGASRARAGS